MTKLKWHPSLKKTFKGCEVWWQSSMVKRDKLGTELARLKNDLEKEGRFITDDPSTLMLIAQTLTTQACIVSGKGELGSVPAPLCWGVTFRALDMLKIATRTYRSDASTLLTSLWTSMTAVGPTMLSDWERARLCAYYLIQLAHKDMRLNVPVIRKEGWGKGTNDAFLIHLFSQAYDIPTHYESVNPMVEPYRQLLEVWKTKDQEAFQQAMTMAAEYHISPAKTALITTSTNSRNPLIAFIPANSSPYKPCAAAMVCLLSIPDMCWWIPRGRSSAICPHANRIP